MNLIAPDYKQKKAAKKNQGIWPETATPEGIDHAIKQGWIAAYFVSSVTALLVLVTMFYAPDLVNGLDAWAFVDVAIMAACGIGMQKWKSRAAAVIALLVFLYGKVYSVTQGQPINATGWILAAVIALYLVNGVRGTFAYQKAKVPKQT